MTSKHLEDTPALEIILPQNYLWDDTRFVHTWPHCLANAETGRTYTMDEIREEIFGMIRGGKSKANRARDILGISKTSTDRVNIQGIGLFEETSEGYIMSPAAIKIASSYSADNTSERWKILLAEHVMKYDIRVRAALYFMGALGFSLITDSAAKMTASPSWKTKLKRDDLTFYVFEKTLRGHLSDLSDFVLLISDYKENLGLDEYTITALAEAVLMLFIHCETKFDPDPKNMSEEGNVDLIDLLSEVLSVAKAVLYHIEDISPDSRVARLRRSIVPYYFTRSRLGRKYKSLSEQKRAKDHIELIATTIHGKLLERDYSEREFADEPQSVILDILRNKTDTIPIDAKSVVLNKMIYAHKSAIIGPFILDRIKEIGLDTDREVIIRGEEDRFKFEPVAARNQFSVPKALKLLYEIGLLEYLNDEWTIDKVNAVELESELAQGLMAKPESVAIVGDAYRLKILHQAYESARLRSGFVSAERLAREFGKRLNIEEAIADYLCQAILSFVRKGMIEVKYKTSLPRYGPGLCGDPYRRLLSIEFITQGRRG